MSDGLTQGSSDSVLLQWAEAAALFDINLPPIFIISFITSLYGKYAGPVSYILLSRISHTIEVLTNP